MSPLRVALFTESYHPVPNGVTTSVDTLARELAGQGHLPTIVAPRFPGFVDAEGVIPVLRIPSWRTPLNPQNPFAYPPLTLSKAVRELGCDIVHTHHPFGIGLHARRLARRRRVPLVATFHTLYQGYGHYVPFLPSGVVATWVSWWLRRFYNGCDAVIAPSEYAAQILRQIGVKSPLHVVPTGVPDAPAERQFQENTHTTDKDDLPILLYVGRMAKEKNLDLLLDMLAFVPDATLWLVGDGADLPRLRRRAMSFPIQNRVRWLGFVPHADLPALYRAATIFVFPSQSETQGIVLGEAQSFGLPVVAVRGGGAAESVRDGVDALVVSHDAAAFARAVRYLLEPARRAVFSTAARANPLRRTPRQSAQAVLKIYNDLLSPS